MVDMKGLLRAVMMVEQWVQQTVVHLAGRMVVCWAESKGR